MRAALKAARIGGDVERAFHGALRHVGPDLVDEPAQKRLLALLDLEPLERLRQVRLHHSRHILANVGVLKHAEAVEHVERRCIERLAIDTVGQVVLTPVTVRREYDVSEDAYRIVAAVATLPQDIVRAPERGGWRRS